MLFKISTKRTQHSCKFRNLSWKCMCIKKVKYCLSNAFSKIDLFLVVLKLKYCEKATKFEKNLLLVFEVYSIRSNKWGFFQKIVVFLENLNFNFGPKIIENLLTYIQSCLPRFWLIFWHVTKHVAHPSSLIFPWNRKLLHLSTKFISSVKKSLKNSWGVTPCCKYFRYKVLLFCEQERESIKAIEVALKLFVLMVWTFELKNWVSDNYVVLCKNIVLEFIHFENATKVC